MRKMTWILLFLVAFSVTVSGSKPAFAKDDIVTYSKTWLNSPYLWGGSTPAGFDCSGYLYFLFKEYGVELPRTSTEQFSVGNLVADEDRLPGDLVFFTTYKEGPSHSGLYIGNDEFIHASENGVEISNLSNPYYSARYLGTKRVLELSTLPTTPSVPDVIVPPIVTNPAPVVVPKPTGPIGHIKITKKINLWSRSTTGRLSFSRILNPGENYRVYSIDAKHGGQYNVGGNYFVTNMDGYVTFTALKN